MAKCDVCGKDESMPYNCRHCGGTFCADHRLPENHDCTGLQDWNDPQGVFDSGFDDSVNGGGGTSKASSLADKIPINTGAGGPLAYFRGNMTYTFLALIWLTFLAQLIVGLFGSRTLYESLFLLTSWNVEYVWTWVTSIFSHSTNNLMHIVGNSIVIFFFGPLVERYVGSRDFAILFVVSGVLAGLSQVLISIAQGYPTAVLGASGAALAIMGVLTILNPDLKVYLYFILPVPIWLLTAGYALISITFLSGVIGGGGGIAHGAHLVGLAIGLAYGQYIKQNRNVSAPNRLEFGGGGGPGGPGGRRRF
ncbi:rhomboid family intramembrane serine protease [Haloterrigena sp. SYSU A558-1]|uniref:Rhomboid family intramembrane serine protease n=1 Tax=Haloterrigena gelatinilytica TaxID=2741724 RepID=A0A8J8KJ29_9EURY|nr:rhomboid family intramembrane serine protease [Haloterrigena gelatinilytica]NUB92894.1 rhomboid family intramembrane serine protease [Haloterrigena gelatinilytica]NUC71194.1 rhomboid family intramembrane serine protease [Haloterrigena gelatinilytica]